MSALPRAAVLPPFLQGLADARDALLQGLPGSGFGWLAASRRAHLAAVLDGGLPGSRVERWRNTPLRALERTPRLPLPPAEGVSVPPALAPLRLVFVDGHFDAAASSVGGLPPGVEAVPLSRGAALAVDTDLAACRPGHAEEACWRRLLPEAPWPDPADAFRNLNAALAGDGLLLRVPAGTRVEQPIELLMLGSVGAPGLWNLRHRLEVGPGAQVTLVERHVAADGCQHLGTSVCNIVLAAGARLRHLRIQQGGGALHVAHTSVQVGAGARYRPLALELGGALSRHEWDVALAGRDASLLLGGLVLAGGRRQVDTRLAIAHQVGDTASDTIWRSVAGGRARASFHGGIRIDAGADGSDAALQARSLLLSQDAAVDAQPVLVIHADEVKASHGAAIGQLDPQALFYLRARGLPEAEARLVLLRAFGAEVLARAVADDPPDAGTGDAAGGEAARWLPLLEPLAGEALQALADNPGASP